MTKPAVDTLAGGRATSLTILILVCIAQFMVVLDVSVVNVALPSIQRELAMTPDSLQWVVNAYALTFAGLLLLGGRAADIYGRKRIFLLGLMLFSLSSLAGGFATSGEVLIIARAVQGLGAAVLAPATLTILTTTFAEGPERARAMSTWGAIGAVGGAVGGLVGGSLTQLLGWRWILWINVPIGVLGMIVAVMVLQESREETRRPMDVPGAVAVTLGLASFEFGLVQTHEHGWGSPRVLIAMAVGIALVGVFIAWQHRSRDPLMPSRLFRSRYVTGANLVQFLVGFSAFAFWYFLSLYMQDILDYSPLQAGLAFLPHTIMIIIASKATPRLVGRVGIRPVILAGVLISIAGFLWQAQATPESTFFTGVLFPGMLITGGMGLTFAPLAMAAMSGVRQEEAGLVSGLLTTSRQVGASLGLAALATVAALRTASMPALDDKHALTIGYDTAFLAAAGVLVVAALAVRALPKPERRSA